MVSVLHVPLFDSNGSSSHAFFLLLSGAGIHPFFNTSKALEGQATLKSTGCIYIIPIIVNSIIKSSENSLIALLLFFLRSPLHFSGCTFYNKWWNNSFILHHVGKRPQIMWTSEVGFLMLGKDCNWVLLHHPKLEAIYK